MFQSLLRWYVLSLEQDVRFINAVYVCYMTDSRGRRVFSSISSKMNVSMPNRLQWSK